jgi:hypothetical protein
MSAILNTKRAAERKLLTLGFPVAFENVDFTPNTGVYLKTQFQIQSPDDPVIGDTYYRERINFQVFVTDDLGKGTANALTVAEAVRNLFEKSSFMDESGTHIYVLSTPRISGSAVTKDRLVVPVIIDLVAEVFN